MDAYSATLLIAMVAAGIASTAVIWTKLRSRGDTLVRIARAAGLLSVLLATLTLGFHFGTDHSPGATNAMDLAAFLAAHPAPLVTMLWGAACTWLAQHAP
jgi:hypothetical protein